MALLMADVHTAEAVVDMNYARYRDDSLKQQMKQSVYARHGVTAAQVDTSFDWYGHNITYYMDVYDRTIEILEHRLIESGNRIAAANALSIAGDSVDVWPGARFMTWNRRVPSRFITFSFSHDQNWKKGDSYTWRAKFFNNPEPSVWALVAEYADGTVDFTSAQVSEDGWKEISIFTDSLATPARVYGYLNVAVPQNGSDMRMDSIAIVRNRLDESKYNLRYRQRQIHKFYPPVDISAASDSAAADTLSRRP